MRIAEGVGTPPRGKGTDLWAVELMGQRDPERLAQFDLPLSVAGLSPDGRYIHLRLPMGEYKGDRWGVSYLYDRTAGFLSPGWPLRQGWQSGWSGGAFQVDGLVQLRTDGVIEKHESFARSLALRPERETPPERELRPERELLSAAFDATGRQVAVVLLGPNPSLRADLLLLGASAERLLEVEGVVEPVAAQLATLAPVALSPTADRIAVAGLRSLVIIDPARPEPEHWIKLQFDDGPYGGALSWAPDGQHLLVPGRGVFDRTGQVKLRIDPYAWGVWNQDGSALALVERGELWHVPLAGGGRRLGPGVQGEPVGYLPDGRLLLAHIR